MNGREARKLRKLSEFKPSAVRYYHQFNNSNNHVLGNNGRLEKTPGTVVEVTENGGAITPKVKYNNFKDAYYGRTI